MVGKNILEHSRASNWSFLFPDSTALDLTDYSQVEAYVTEHKPDFVIHAAGLVGGIQANMAAPVNFLVANLDMGRNVVLAAKSVGVKHLVNLGSSCMYPREAANPLTEDLILQGELEPTNEGYALAKIVTMKLCQYVSQQNREFQYKTVIPCNLYGRYDKFSPNNSHLIPAIIHKVYQAIKNNEQVVEIWGDGSARREFMYAGDLADAIIYALDNFDSMPELINIGLGHDHTINEYYEAVARVLGYGGEFVHNLNKPVGMARKLVDIKKQMAWGWTPQTSLENGLRETYSYYLDSGVVNDLSVS